MLLYSAISIVIT